MSNHNPDEKSGPRKSKVSVAMAINHGLGGPKVMAKAAADGQSVNIPTPERFGDGGTEEINLSASMAWRFWLSEWFSWQIRKTAFNGAIHKPKKGEVFTLPIQTKSLPRKTSKLWKRSVRTVNRHWWVRRVASGERVKSR